MLRIIWSSFDFNWTFRIVKTFFRCVRNWPSAMAIVIFVPYYLKGAFCSRYSLGLLDELLHRSTEDEGEQRELLVNNKSAFFNLFHCHERYANHPYG